MIVFVDASAMVAMMTKEQDHLEIERRFATADDGLCSAVSLWETALAVARKRTVSVIETHAEVRSFVVDFALRLVSIGEAESAAAIDAHERYGRGRHPAGLNMGDCFAYACARTNGAAILYKGADFALTDLA